MRPHQSIAAEVREVLRPIWRRLTVGRTMSVGKLGILANLSTNGRTTASVLSMSENISQQAIATAVRELHELGLVSRTPDVADRRRTWISITDAGTEQLAQERADGLGWLEQAIGTRLTEAEQENLVSLLPILRKLTTEQTIEPVTE